MVCDWSPEPPSDMDDHMAVPSQIVAVESDESEEEMLGNGPPGYELLWQGPAMDGSSDEEDQTDAENSSSVPTSSSVPVNAASTSDSSMRHSEVEEVVRLYAEPALRPELTVDCDAVRAAMSGFSLPPSSIPSWATEVPEHQWAATLAQHIQRIQTDRVDT